LPFLLTFDNFVSPFCLGDSNPPTLSILVVSRIRRASGAINERYPSKPPKQPLLISAKIRVRQGMEA